MALAIRFWKTLSTLGRSRVISISLETSQIRETPVRAAASVSAVQPLRRSGGSG